MDLTSFIRDVPDFPKKGIVFKDITPLLADHGALSESVAQLVARFSGEKVDLVASVEARGFLFAVPIALRLNAALVPIRKPGKLPHETLSYTYDLEYGTDTLEIHADAVAPGAKVLVVDDLLATGGTVEACCKMVEQCGGSVVGCAFLIELVGLHGAERIQQYQLLSLIKYG